MYDKVYLSQHIDNFKLPFQVGERRRYFQKECLHLVGFPNYLTPSMLNIVRSLEHNLLGQHCSYISLADQCLGLIDDMFKVFGSQVVVVLEIVFQCDTNSVDGDRRVHPLCSKQVFKMRFQVQESFV